MRRELLLIVMGALMISICVASVSWALDPYMSYQGQLTNQGGIPLDTTVTIVFSCYQQPTGGVSIWTQTIPNVSVQGGHFAVVLGPFTALLFQNPLLYLGVKVGNDSEMTPRRQVTCSGQSINTGGMNMINWDYDSGWVNCSYSGASLTHNLGGDPSLYFVYVVGKDSVSQTIHQYGYGALTVYINPAHYHVGAYISGITATQIGIARGSEDDWTNWSHLRWDYCRVRILKNQ